MIDSLSSEERVDVEFMRNTRLVSNPSPAVVTRLLDIIDRLAPKPTALGTVLNELRSKGLGDIADLVTEALERDGR